MTVKEALYEVFSEAGFEPPADNDDLYTLGIDSLELVQMSIDVGEKLQIDIDVKKLDKVKTMADLTKLVKAYVRMRGHLDECGGRECVCGFREVFWEDPVRKVADELLLH